MGRGNNYGLRTRDMARAGQRALNNAVSAGSLGYQSAGDIGGRWQQFAQYCYDQDIRRLEQIQPEMLQSFGRELAEKVHEGELSASHAQNLVSAANTTLKHASQGAWKPVHAVADCGIERRSNVREIAPQLAREPVAAAANDLRRIGNERGAAVLELARDMGLRAREASLLDAQRASVEARERGVVKISDGTKGGREREILISSEQLRTLEKAAEVQNDARAVMPADSNWVQWENVGLRNARETLQSHGIQRIHDLRSAYACERYEQLRYDNDDRDARLKVSRELGHNRIDILSSYIPKGF